ncbi:MAG: hypothetical protein IKZ09_02075 [Clostridia bacterium]|nr:hypothetical protein [Clostridia bacterium]
MQNTAAIDLSRLYGNEALKSVLVRAAAEGRTTHAYLLEGGFGTGKTTLAFLFSAALCCESTQKRPCMQCPSCRKILRAQSPDLCVIGIDALPFAPELPVPNTVGLTKTGSIGVEAVRALKSDIYIRANDLEHKLYIIGHTERMTVQAQNALLKVLEEPPEGAIFFLLCENRAALLPTVLSRVQRLTMEAFSDEMLYSLLCEHDRDAASLARTDEDALRLYVRLADGSFGRASQYVHAQKKDLASDAAYEAHASAAAVLGILFSNIQTDDSFVLSAGSAAAVRPTVTSLMSCISERVAAKRDGTESRERLRALIDALSAAVRDLAMCERGVEGQLLFYPTMSQPQALCVRCSAKALSDTARALMDLRADLASNPNVSMLLMSLSEILIGLRT